MSQASTVQSTQPAPGADAPIRRLRNITAKDFVLWLLIAIVAWAPFPIGSNRPWSWSLLVLLIAALWLIWLASAFKQMDLVARHARTIAIPLVLASIALAWGVVQVLPIVPAGWVHPVWAIASEALGRKLPGTISLDAWHTETEVMKLVAYAMAGWLAYSLSRESGRARRLFLALVAIGSFYVLYAWLFAFMGWYQFQIFYLAPEVGNRVAAPFVNRNTLATFAGLTSLCCGLKLIELAGKAIIRQKGYRNLLLSTLQFGFGSGVAILLAAILSFSTVIATGSLAGTIATLAAIFFMFAVSTAAILRTKMDRGTAITMAVLGASLIGLVVLNGSELAARLSSMATAGVSEGTRVSLWSATERMIQDAPLLGLGLGTFEKAYPLYAQNFFPYVMDKAHNDFLELAAGLGLPAAVAWVGSLACLMAMCVRGVFVRNRDRMFALAGLGATALVGVHSLFDFSLQIPAVALFYSVILGLGVAQSIPSHQRDER